MGMGFSSDAGFGNGVGWSGGPNIYKNPYTQGGPLFAKGYGDQRHVLQAGVDYPYPQPQQLSNDYTVGQGLQQKKASGSSGFGYWSQPSDQVPTPAPLPASSTSPNIQTTITPQSVYTPQDTRAATNQAIADSQMNANLRWLQKPYDKPGVSRSASQLALAIPQAQQYLSQGQLAAQQIPFSDATTNAQSLLRGQTGRDAEGLGLANVLSQFNASNMGYNTAQNSSLLNLISSLLGGSLGGSSGGIGSILGGL